MTNNNYFFEGKELEKHIKERNHDLVLKDINNSKKINNLNKQIGISNIKRNKKRKV